MLVIYHWIAKRVISNVSLCAHYVCQKMQGFLISINRGWGKGNFTFTFLCLVNVSKYFWRICYIYNLIAFIWNIYPYRKLRTLSLTFTTIKESFRKKNGWSRKLVRVILRERPMHLFSVLWNDFDLAHN